MIQPLVKDSLYYAEFHVSFANHWDAVNLGIYFTGVDTSSGTSYPFVLSPQIVSNELIRDTANWVKVSGTFKAKGGEQYLIIGLFEENKFDPRRSRKYYPNGIDSYYFVDDICVTKAGSRQHSGCIANSVDSMVTSLDEVQTFYPGKSLVLPDITFQVNKWDISPDITALLDSLVVFLEENPTYQVSVSGHTDNSGLETANLTLSENRAQAVKRYLLTQGIDSQRVSVMGHGSLMPVASNESTEGKIKNRRVEIMIIE